MPFQLDTSNCLSSRMTDDLIHRQPVQVALETSSWNGTRMRFAVKPLRLAWVGCFAILSCTAPSPTPRPKVEAPSVSSHLSIEAIPTPEHNVFPLGKMPFVRLRLRNPGERQADASIQGTVADSRRKEVHRSSQTVTVAPRSSSEVDFPLPITALGYFEAVFRVESAEARPLTVPFVVLRDKRLRPGSLIGWPEPRLKGVDPRAQADRLTRDYLDLLSTHKVRAVQWRESAAASGEPPPTPVMAALHTLATLLEGATFRRKIEAGPIRAYRFFKEGDKGATWAVWSGSPCGPVALRPLDCPVVMTDLMGNAEAMKPRENTVILGPNESPIFVTLPTMEIMSVTPILSVTEQPAKVRAGESAQVVVEVWNPFKDTLTATVSASLPRDWSGPSAETVVKVEQGARQRAPIKFVVPPTAKPGQETVKVAVKFDRSDLPPSGLLVLVEVQR